MYNDDNYNIDNDCNMADITGNIIPPPLSRQNAFLLRNKKNDTSYTSNCTINEFTDYTEEIFIFEQEISNDNEQEIEINLDEIINRSIPSAVIDELNIINPPCLRQIQSESKESVTLKSFNTLPPLTKFYSF